MKQVFFFNTYISSHTLFSNIASSAHNSHRIESIQVQKIFELNLDTFVLLDYNLVQMFTAQWISKCMIFEASNMRNATTGERRKNNSYNNKNNLLGLLQQTYKFEGFPALYNNFVKC